MLLIGLGKVKVNDKRTNGHLGQNSGMQASWQSNDTVCLGIYKLRVSQSWPLCVLN